MARLAQAAPGSPRAWLVALVAGAMASLLVATAPAPPRSPPAQAAAPHVPPFTPEFTFTDSLRVPMPPDDPQPPMATCARVVRPRGWLARENSRPGATGWTVPRAQPHGVVGYTDQPSVRCGDVVRIHLAGPAVVVRVRAYRLGWYHGVGARLVWVSPPVRVLPRPVRVRATMPYTVSARWPVSLTVPVTLAWLPGVYVLVPQPLRGSPGQAIPLVVRDDAGREPLLVKLSTFTWAAYDTFGRHSLYVGPARRGDPTARLDGRSREVTLRRPLAGQGYQQMVVDALPLVPFVERLGLDVAYITDLDLDQQPSDLLRHSALVSDGHSEYWTARMLDAATAARNAGVNLAFLGANNIYWHARLRPTSDDGPHLVVYRDLAQDPVAAAHPSDATVRWQVPPLDRDESSLLGQTSAAILVRGSFVVVHTPAWLTATQMAPGNVLLDAVGNEADATAGDRPNPPGDETLAVSVLAGPRPGLDRIATMNYYASPSGAGVFAAGTTYWVCDLSGSCPLLPTPPATVRAATLITDQLLRAFATARAGARYPSVPTPPVTAAQVLASYPDAPVGSYAIARRGARDVLAGLDPG